jgi:hypothetical protein
MTRHSGRPARAHWPKAPLSRGQGAELGFVVKSCPVDVIVVARETARNTATVRKEWCTPC